MTRIKRGSIAKKRRKKIINLTKGFSGSNSKLFRVANQICMKALKYAYFSRRKKVTNFKKLWINRINITSKLNNIKYNNLIKNLKLNKLDLNKKILAKLFTIDKTIIKQLLQKIKK
jgi:large subunit ribosomal protein L20